MKAGLVGDHIGPSFTPDMHEHEGEQLGLSYRYDRFDTSDGATLEQVVGRARSEGFAGLNITHPHKHAVTVLMDRLQGAAAEVKSVNTVIFQGDKAIGANTDYTGFKIALSRQIGDVTGDSVRQLGAGGAGASVALALLDAGVGALSLFDVSPSRARALKATLARARPGAAVHIATEPDESADSMDGMVNCTPLGMVEHPGMAVDPALFFPRCWAADIVYFPQDTAFLRASRKHGMRVMDGTHMALWQAVEAFRLITRNTPDPARMEAHLTRLLAARNGMKFE